MDDLPGFYRIDPNGDFQQAPNFVFAPDYTLRAEDHLTYTYPTAGDWRWFDSLSAAQSFYEVNIPIQGE